MTEFDPSETDIFLAADGFSPDSQAFSGIDAFAPGGPAPHFGPGEVAPRTRSIDCTDVQHSLQLYLDGELVAPQHQLIAGHLARCLACQSAQIFQTQLRTVVAQRALDPMPDDVRKRIIRALGM